MEREIAARKRAEDALQRANAELERRVQERTIELAKANAFLDESQRREKERADEFETLLRATPTPIWMAHDPHCHRITGNPASLTLLGLPEGTNVSATSPAPDVGKRGFREFRGDQPIPADELPIQRAARGELVTGAEVKLVFDDGRVRYIYGNAVPLRNSDGSVRGCLGAFADVTPLKEAEQSLRRNEEILREADRRKDEFLATLAHELRNPLAPIRNAVALLRNASDDPAVMEEARKIMDRQVGQMVRLIDDLLDISRVTRGKLNLRKERLELSAAVRSAVEESQPLIQASGHELTITLPQESVVLDADPTRLAQILSNLLCNAAKYQDKGGHIWLTAEQHDAEVLVSVRDTGIGIDADHLPHIFEMFSQAAPALERSQGGLGIGLALVRGLVDLHGGTIAAHSNGPGMGSEFVVRLPVLNVGMERPTEVPIRDQARQPLSKHRILVVDDNTDSATSLAMILGRLGHEVRTAHDGLEAVQAAAAFHPDVVLLDIGLPKLNGYDAAKRMREQLVDHKMAIIALSGWGQERDRQRALEAGFDHHLTKPVEYDTLREALGLAS